MPNLERKDVITIIEHGNPDLRERVSRETKEAVIETWERDDRPLPWEVGPIEEEGVGWRIDRVNQYGRGFRINLRREEDALDKDVIDSVKRFVSDWGDRIVGVYEKLQEESDFPPREFQILVLWGPEWDPDDGLTTTDRSLTGPEIADLLDIEHNTVRGHKGKIRNRIRTADRTLKLAHGEIW